MQTGTITDFEKRIKDDDFFWQQEKTRKARNNFVFFYNTIFFISIQIVDGEFIEGKWPDEFCARLQKYLKTCTLAARKHSKTTIMLGFVAWLIFRADIKAKMVSEYLYIMYSDDLACEKVKRLKQYISINPFFAHIRDMKPTAETVLEYENNGHIINIQPAGVFTFKRGKHPDGVICVPGHTTIDILDGSKQIKNVKCGDYVRTHTGKYQKVIKIMSRKHYGVIYEIKLSNLSLLITGNHPILTNRGFVKAKDIRIGDKLQWKDTSGINQYILFKNKKITNRKQIKKILINSNIAFFLGLYCAEGCLRNGKTIALTFSKKEENLLLNSKNIFERIFKIKTYTDGHLPWAISIIGYSVAVYEKFKEMFGENARNKKIPIEIINSPARIKASFIMGLLYGDGSKYKSGAFGFGVASYKLRDDLIKLLGTLSISATSISKYSQKKSTYGGTDLYRCYISKIAIQKLKQIISDDYMVIDVNKKENSTGRVFNLEVEKDNTYVANGITIHNCDDILRDPQKKLDLIQIEKVTQAFEAEITSLAIEGGFTHVVGTSQDETDIMYKLQKLPGWNWKCRPAIIDRKKKIVLWPEKYPFDRLIDIELNETGKKNFQREYQMLPVRSTEGYFLRGEIEGLIDKELTNYSIYRVSKDDEFGETFGGMDLGKKRHPSHLCVLEAVEEKDVIYLIQICSLFLDGTDYNDQLKIFGDAIRRFGMQALLWDNTRAEFDGFAERGELPSEMFPVTMSAGGNDQIAADFDKQVGNKTIILLDDERQTRSILAVDGNLKAAESIDGHGDAFWSVGLAIQAFLKNCMKQFH